MFAGKRAVSIFARGAGRCKGLSMPRREREGEKGGRERECPFLARVGLTETGKGGVSRRTGGAQLKIRG